MFASVLMEFSPQPFHNYCFHTVFFWDLAFNAPGAIP